MAFIKTVPQEEAEGEVREMYEADLERLGYVANHTKIFSQRPDVYKAWQGLNAAIKANMDLRRYEVATLASAQALRSSYCCLAHGQVMLQFVPQNDLIEIMSGERDILTPVETAIMAFAEKVTLHAYEVTQADVDVLREHGLTDPEIMDIVLASSARNFFSRVLDGSGTLPDAAYRSLEPKLYESLTVGREVAPS